MLYNWYTIFYDRFLRKYSHVQSIITWTSIVNLWIYISWIPRIFQSFCLRLDILFLTYSYESTHPGARKMLKCFRIYLNIHDFSTFSRFSFKNFESKRTKSCLWHQKILHKIPHRTVYMRSFLVSKVSQNHTTHPRTPTHMSATFTIQSFHQNF